MLSLLKGLARRIVREIKNLPENLILAFDVLLFHPLLCLLPYGWAYPITRWRGKLHFRIMGKLRNRILEDLGECLPELTEEQRQQAARLLFQVQATYFYDTYLWTRYREKKWTKKFVSFHGDEFEKKK